MQAFIPRFIIEGAEHARYILAAVFAVLVGNRFRDLPCTNRATKIKIVDGLRQVG